MPMAQPLAPFEDFIDGYFPLQETLRQFLDRRQWQAAWVELAYAPILHVPGLGYDAPVPLNIRSGIPGLIYRMDLWVSRTPTGVAIGGIGTWRWLNKAGAAPVFDTTIRLAEPAFIRGYAPIPNIEPSAFVLDAMDTTTADGILKEVTFSTLIGPIPTQEIRFSTRRSVTETNLANGRYLAIVHPD